MRAEKALTKIDRDYVRYIRNMNILKNSMDRAQRIYDLKKEARKEVMLEVARKMKKAGRPFCEITEFTGLPVETFEKL